MSGNPQVKSRLTGYRAHNINAVWHRVEHHIQRALDRGSIYTLEDIKHGLQDSMMQLWCWEGEEIEACLVTTIQTDKQGKFCLLLAAGGSNMREWLKFLPILEEWAAGNGCREMRIYGRHGWARAIQYDIDYTVMRKELCLADRAT